MRAPNRYKRVMVVLRAVLRTHNRGPMIILIFRLGENDIFGLGKKRIDTALSALLLWSVITRLIRHHFFTKSPLPKCAPKDLDLGHD